MALVKTAMTADELLKLTDDQHKYELVRGELKTMTPTGGQHGQTSVQIGAILHSFVKQHKLGSVFAAETGYVLQHSPDTVRAPDASFVSRERIPPGGVPETYLPVAPDLAVEVVSPGDSAHDLHEKVSEYLTAGTRLVWVVFPRNKTVVVHRSLKDVRVFTADETLDGADVLPGFACRVSEFFE